MKIAESIIYKIMFYFDLKQKQSPNNHILAKMLTSFFSPVRKRNIVIGDEYGKSKIKLDMHFTSRCSTLGKRFRRYLRSEFFFLRLVIVVGDSQEKKLNSYENYHLGNLNRGTTVLRVESMKISTAKISLILNRFFRLILRIYICSFSID